MKKEDFIAARPELASLPQTLKLKRYEHSEKKRLERIEKAKKMREKIIKNKLMGQIYGDASLSNSINMSNRTGGFFHNEDPKRKTAFSPGGTVTSFNLRRTQSTSELWLLNQKREQMSLLQKQNLSEIKNLIDDAMNIKEKAQRQKEKMLQLANREEQINLMRAEFRYKKEKQQRENERKHQQFLLKEKKEQEREYRELNRKMRAKEEEEFRRELQRQKMSLERKKKEEKENEEFKEKLYNINENLRKKMEKKHEIMCIKDANRLKKMEMKRRIIDQKNKENEMKRNIKLQAVFKKKEKLQENKLNKFMEKQKNIEDFSEKVRESRSKKIEEQRFEREMKQRKNITMRLKNDEESAERRRKLIEKFKEDEEKMRTFQERNNNELEQRIYQNIIREEEKSQNLLEFQNKITFKNVLKLQEMDKKTKRVHEKFIEKKLDTKKKIDLEKSLKEKKDRLRREASRVLSKNHNYTREQIYHKIFSPEDLDILSNDAGRKKVFFTPNKSIYLGDKKDEEKPM